MLKQGLLFKRLQQISETALRIGLGRIKETNTPTILLQIGPLHMKETRTAPSFYGLHLRKLLILTLIAMED